MQQQKEQQDQGAHLQNNQGIAGYLLRKTVQNNSLRDPSNFSEEMSKKNLMLYMCKKAKYMKEKHNPNLKFQEIANNIKFHCKKHEKMFVMNQKRQSANQNDNYEDIHDKELQQLLAQKRSQNDFRDEFQIELDIKKQQDFMRKPPSKSIKAVKSNSNNLLNQEQERLKNLVFSKLTNETTDEIYEQYKQQKSRQKILNIKYSGIKYFDLKDKLLDEKTTGNEKEDKKEFLEKIVIQKNISVGNLVGLHDLKYIDQISLEQRQQMRRKNVLNYEDKLQDLFYNAKLKEEKSLIKQYKETKLDVIDINNVELKRKQEKQDEMHNNMVNAENKNLQTATQGSQVNSLKFVRRPKTTFKIQNPTAQIDFIERISQFKEKKCVNDKNFNSSQSLDQNSAAIQQNLQKSQIFDQKKQNKSFTTNMSFQIQRNNSSVDTLANKVVQRAALTMSLNNNFYVGYKHKSGSFYQKKWQASHTQSTAGISTAILTPQVAPKTPSLQNKNLQNLKKILFRPNTAVSLDDQNLQQSQSQQYIQQQQQQSSIFSQKNNQQQPSHFVQKPRTSDDLSKKNSQKQPEIDKEDLIRQRKIEKYQNLIHKLKMMDEAEESKQEIKEYELIIHKNKVKLDLKNILKQCEQICQKNLRDNFNINNQIKRFNNSFNNQIDELIKKWALSELKPKIIGQFLEFSQNRLFRKQLIKYLIQQVQSPSEVLSKFHDRKFNLKFFDILNDESTLNEN